MTTNMVIHSCIFMEVFHLVYRTYTFERETWIAVRDKVGGNAVSLIWNTFALIEIL